MDDIRRKLGVYIKDGQLLQKAFVHPSYANETSFARGEDYERLEFLGDAVLSSAVSEMLYNLYPFLNEGKLTKLRASLINEKTLYEVGKSFGLNKYVMLGKGEEKSGGRRKPSILCDVFEAVIGVIYLDLGYDCVKALIWRIFEPLALMRDTGDVLEDYKSALQEEIQARFKCIPLYIEEEMEDAFLIKVVINDRIYGAGTGSSKKEAGQIAAKKALDCLKKEDIGV